MTAAEKHASRSFYIVTPSRNQRDYLKLCIHSIADQRGVRVHHHVQDCASTDGTVELLRRHQSACEGRRGYSFSFESVEDGGMYDAVNRGWRRGLAKGYDFVAYLNCDEQYLDSTLRRVAQSFDASPRTDVFYGHALVIRENGDLVCRREVVIPNRYHILVSHLPVFTAATFIRADAILDNNLFFDTQFKASGDAEWTLRMIDKKVRFGLIRRYLATFVSRPDNLALSRKALAELALLKNQAPRIVQKLVEPIKVHHRLKKVISGAYFPKDVAYDIYLSASSERIHFSFTNASSVWHERRGRDRIRSGFS